MEQHTYFYSIMTNEKSGERYQSGAATASQELNSPEMFIEFTNLLLDELKLPKDRSVFISFNKI